MPSDIDACNYAKNLIIDTLKKVTPADPNEPVLLPGEPEQISKAKRLKSGIPINDNLHTIIKDIAKNAGVDCLL